MSKFKSLVFVLKELTPPRIKLTSIGLVDFWLKSQTREFQLKPIKILLAEDGALRQKLIFPEKEISTGKQITSDRKSEKTKREKKGGGGGLVRYFFTLPKNCLK